MGLHALTSAGSGPKDPATALPKAAFNAVVGIGAKKRASEDARLE